MGSKRHAIYIHISSPWTLLLVSSGRNEAEVDALGLGHTTRCARRNLLWLLHARACGSSLVVVRAGLNLLVVIRVCLVKADFAVGAFSSQVKLNQHTIIKINLFVAECVCGCFQVSGDEPPPDTRSVCHRRSAAVQSTGRTVQRSEEALPAVPGSHAGHWRGCQDGHPGVPIPVSAAPLELQRGGQLLGVRQSLADRYDSSQVITLLMLRMTPKLRGAYRAQSPGKPRMDMPVVCSLHVGFPCGHRHFRFRSTPVPEKAENDLF